MDCTLIHDRLLGYHFATLPDGERADVETHLVECKECLRTYLALKSRVDRGMIDDDAPGPATRARLRAAVEARFRPTAAHRIHRWLVKPIPLYQGLAVAAAVIAAIAVGPTLARVLRPGPASHEAERVDTARRSAESLTIY